MLRYSKSKIFQYEVKCIVKKWNNAIKYDEITISCSLIFYKIMEPAFAKLDEIFVSDARATEPGV